MTFLACVEIHIFGLPAYVIVAHSVYCDLLEHVNRVLMMFLQHFTFETNKYNFELTEIWLVVCAINNWLSLSLPKRPLLVLMGLGYCFSCMSLDSYLFAF
jgi:hypothetical protein